MHKCDMVRKKVYFVSSRGGHKWCDLDKLPIDPNIVDSLYSRFVTGVDVWIFQTYLVVRKYLNSIGVDAEFSDRFVPKSVCIVHRDDLKPRSNAYGSYVVAVRADRPPVYACEIDVVQNRSNARKGRSYFLQHWPQPGLLKRQSSRGDSVRRVAYFGREEYLPREFTDGEFSRKLRSRGIEFVVRNRDWNDYSDIDLVLAVRREHPSVLRSKPASKLINAWLAEVPAMLSHEPAYLYLKETKMDFVEIATAEDAIDAIDKFISCPHLYKNMVKNGKDRGRDFTRERIAKSWCDFIVHNVIPSYEEWKSSVSNSIDVILRARFLSRMARQKVISCFYGPRV